MSVAFKESEGPSSSEQMEVDRPEASVSSDKWIRLPSIPLRLIYSLVPRMEQANMSKVCKLWFDDFETPSNWTTLRFTFPTKPFPMPYLPPVKFAIRYGRLVKNVEISCRRRCPVTFSKAMRQYETFVKAIRERSHIQSITVFNLKQIFAHIGKKYRRRVVNGICKIFKTEKTIESVSFSLCSFNRKEMQMIFTQMFVQSSSPIKKLQTRRMQRRLKLRFFRLGDRFPIECRQWIICMLQRLEEWETDYRQIVERVVRGFYRTTPEQLATYGRGTRGTLKLITIRYEEWTFRHMKGIPSWCWQALCDFCPDLKVDFTIGPTIDPRVSLFLLLQRGIPLRSFSFRTSGRKHKCRNFQIKDVFNHLTRRNLIETLEDLTVIWATPSPTIIEDLDVFVQACPMLKSVEIQVAYPLPLQHLFHFLTCSRPEVLEEVLFTVNKIPSEEEYNRMTSMGQHYIPVLKVMGINFTLNLNKSRDLLVGASYQ